MRWILAAVAFMILIAGIAIAVSQNVQKPIPAHTVPAIQGVIQIPTPPAVING